MSEEISLIQQAVRAAIQDVAVGPDRGRDIPRERAELVMSAILDGAVDEVQAAVLLIALRMKRESLDEFFGLFTAMQQSVESVTAQVDELICLADPFDGYVRTATMTPFIAPVLAACGTNALIHGVETVGPKHGVTAHKVYKMAGIDTSLPSTQVAARLQELKWCYIDQSVYAPKLYRLNNLRDRIIKRTAVTTLERLLLPVKAAGKTHLALGYVHKAYPEIYAAVAEQAGYSSVLLYKGVEGGLAPALNKPIRRFHFDMPLPTDIAAGKEILPLENVFDAGTSAMPMDAGAAMVEQTLDAGLAVLDGRSGRARDSLVLAAGHILMSLQPPLSLADAVEKVQNCLDNGSAKAYFENQISSAA